MLPAGDVAVDEITPISDVRGAADYRYQLTRNILLKFYHESQAMAVVDRKLELEHADAECWKTSCRMIRRLGPCDRPGAVYR